MSLLFSISSYVLPHNQASWIAYSLLLWSALLTADPLITAQDVAHVAAAPGRELTKVVDFGHQLRVPIHFSITSKGNGGFQLPGLFLVRIYDRHEDGSVFRQGLLHNDLIDLDDDGYLELVLWGTALISDPEQEMNADSPQPEPVVAIIHYAPVQHIFKISKDSDYIDIYRSDAD